MPVPQVMAEASIDAIFDLIKSCSYPRNKAKHLSGLAKMELQILMVKSQQIWRTCKNYLV